MPFGEKDEIVEPVFGANDAPVATETPADQFNTFLDTLPNPEEEWDRIGNTLYFANELVADPNDVPMIYDSTEDIAERLWGNKMSQGQIAAKIKEEEERPWGTVIRGALSRGGLRLGRALADLPRHTLRQGELLSQRVREKGQLGLIGRAAEPYRPLLEEVSISNPDSPIYKILGDPADWVNKGVDQILKNHPEWEGKPPKNVLDLISSPKKLTQAVLESVPLLVGAGGLMATGHPVPAVTLMYASEGQEAYDQAKADGATDIEAEQAFAIYGSVAAAIEYAQIRRGIKLIKGGYKAIVARSAQKAIGQMAETGTTSLTKQWLTAVAEETVEEMAQGTWQEVTAKMVYGKDPEGGLMGFADRRAQEAVIAATLTAVAGAGAVTAGGVAKAVEKGKVEPTKEELPILGKEGVKAPAKPVGKVPKVEGEVKIKGTPQEKKLVDEFAEGLTTQEWKEEYQKGKLPHWMTDKEPSPLSKELSDDLKKENIKQANILEIGIGNGRDSIFLAKQGHTATGIDVAEQAVTAAKKNAGKLKTVTFEKGNVEKLKYPDNSFNAVFSVAALHSTPLDDSLAEIYRVLKPGGIAKIHQYTRIETAGKIIHYWKPKQIKQIAEAIGFSIVESHTTTKTDFVKVEGVKEKIKQDNDIIVYTIKKPPAKPEGKVEVLPESEKVWGSLRQRIHAIAAKKGLTKKALSELKAKHTGYRKLTGKIASKKITLEQLQNLLKAVEKARPKRVGYKRVITRKTENKIQSLKENLIKKTQMTEAHYKDVLAKEIQGREPKYIDAKSFITETQGKDIIRRMLDTAEIVRLTESFEQAIAKDDEIATEVKSLDSRIEKAPKRDPYSLESMRYYNQQAQAKTGAPIFTAYMDLMDTHLDMNKTRTATWKRLENSTEKFKAIAKDEAALKRVSDYIASQSALEEKPPAPTDITADEVKLAKEIQKIFEEYQLKVRATKFFNWYYYQQPIPDADRYQKEITKATDIYESKGREELIEYLDTQEWGVVKSGYEPLEILFHKIQPYTTGPAAVGKGHIKIRTDIEYHKQERNILQRLSSYMRQIDMLYNLSPKINAYVRLFDDNAGKFNNWGKVKGDIEIFLRNLKRYNLEGGFFERTIARAYSQAMRVIIMPSPVLAFRNLFQNAAFEHDKSILIDTRNKKLTDEQVEYLETYILQTRGMVEEYFMIGEKPLPGLKFLTSLIDQVKIYPYSDIANRHWGFWAKTNQVGRALEAKTTKEMMTVAKFEDMTPLEQRRALGILARDGKEAMTRYVGRVHVDDIHFLYERSQRSPAEMTTLGKVVGNLMLFPRAYGEKLAHATNKMLKGKTTQEQYRGMKTLFAVIAGGMIVGSLYKRVTRRKRNPYNPLNILAFRPGGLAWGAIEVAGDVYATMLSALMGDKKAAYQLTSMITRLADMFIPFYDYTLRGLEALTDQKNIDRKALREILATIDKEYKVRGGAYKVKRTALEKWQYFIAGAGVDEEAKKPKPKRIKR